jgi:putative endonuclease
MKNTTGLGSLGEQITAKFLRDKGFEIVEMNYKNDSGRRLGEIDIIAKENGEWVFVEVKTREYHGYKNTLPEENITSQKLRKLSRIAENYLRQKNILEDNFRFDAVSVWVDNANKMAKIKHLRNIFL